MKIIRAEEMGMCFGVRDALQMTREMSDPTQVTVYGELVHNPVVQNQLASAGYRQASEADRCAGFETPLVLITAHGISNAERQRLNDQGKQMIDTTCPLVRRVHDAALELQSEGRHILLIGKAGHVEVRGIVEDLESYDVVEHQSQVATYSAARLGVLAQSTMPTDTVANIVDQIRHCNPSADIRFIDTICRPTKLRQSAMQSLLDKVEAVVVVGGKNSNNTQRLVTLCERRGVRAWHVESADDLQDEWFDGIDTVGLTAGTSTLDETIDAVERSMEQIARTRQFRA